MRSTHEIARRLRGLSVAVAVVVLAASVLAATESIVQTVAGGGNLEGYAPNDAAVSFASTSGVALHPVTGELYFSDTNHHQVYRVNATTGLIVLVAGNGTDSFSGDGGIAVAAGVSKPGALAFNATGTALYVADNGNLRVRRVDMTTGIISTLAGNGLTEGVVPAGGTVPTPAGDGGPATSAAFGGSVGGIVVLSTGDVLLSDTANQYVRRVDSLGNISPFAGTIDSAGSNGDGGQASAAQLRNPRGLVVDTSGNVYIATQGGGSADDRVRRVDPLGVISTFSGKNAVVVPDPNGDGGSADVARLTDPETLGYDPVRQLLYVGSFGNGAVRVIRMTDAPPSITTLAGTGGTVDTGPAGANSIACSGMAVDASGDLYLAATGPSSIRRIDAATGFVDTVVGRTSVVGEIGDRSPAFTAILDGPTAMAFDAAGNLYVSNTGSHSVRRFRTDGTTETVAGTGAAGYTGDGGPAFEATLDTPLDVEVVGTTLFVADSNNGMIRAVDLTTGLIRTFAQMNNGNPLSIAADGAGNLFVTTDGGTVERVATNGTVTDFAGQNGGGSPGDLDSYTGPASDATLLDLRGIAVAGNGDVYVTEGSGGDRVRKFSANGLTTTRIAGSAAAGPGFSGDGADALLAQLDRPVGIALTATGIVVADSRNHRLRSIDTTAVPNKITTVAGDGTAGLTGEGGPSGSARVNDPREVIVSGGSIFFADRGNNRIRTMTDAIVVDPKNLSLTTSISFRRDKKTGLPVRGSDSLSLRAALPLPAGVNPANLVVRTDVVDLRDQVQLDAKGRPPKPAAATVGGPHGVFDFDPVRNVSSLASILHLGLKKVSTGTGKPAVFTWSARGTFSDDLGRAGLVDATTDKHGIALPVRVNITLGTVTFTGVTTVTWRAKADKGGTAHTAP
jgi:sugar lactone lactonase YvrE